MARSSTLWPLITRRRVTCPCTATPSHSTSTCTRTAWRAAQVPPRLSTGASVSTSSSSRAPRQLVSRISWNVWSNQFSIFRLDCDCYKYRFVIVRKAQDDISIGVKVRKVIRNRYGVICSICQSILFTSNCFWTFFSPSIPPSNRKPGNSTWGLSFL